MKCPTCRKREPPVGRKVCDHCLEIAKRAHKNRRLERATADLCRRCGDPPLESMKYCKACLKYMQSHGRNRRNTLTQKGCCTRCGNSPLETTRLCEPCAEKERQRSRVKSLRLKREVLTAYGNPPVCICCKESNLKFLTIDHVDGGGNQHRKQIQVGGGSHVYLWLKRNKFPQGFQVLCFNCNCGRAVNDGVCPHKEI